MRFSFGLLFLSLFSCPAFSMPCEGEASSRMDFSVVQPQEVHGHGSISNDLTSWAQECAITYGYNAKNKLVQLIFKVGDEQFIPALAYSCNQNEVRHVFSEIPAQFSHPYTKSGDTFSEWQIPPGRALIPTVGFCATMNINISKDSEGKPKSFIINRSCKDESFNWTSACELE